ncbi:NmrA family NAD(P)-binding protein [Alloacidobacterium dinghuense]|uniref:NmrA family NAD(P)-binding protein n=1 Tax=Alloacidobacterium dinghuense TaxID=2763107 RepID=A0A7G8BGM7_9BACT|nr:NmrA family NAD(P)-binding protein [Alloacidobacterium dinghuense]QNI31697.1 NmrA family NAD(P)-binding protein [Alloacidobacterium dinghuense]
MFAITGVTGKVGGAVARSLLAQGHKVRAVVRDAEKGRPWSAQGCDIAIASVEDAAGFTKAFQDVEGVFLMTPPDYDPDPGFPQTHEAAKAIRHAIETARPEKIVFLSTVGAQIAEPNLLNNSKITEEMLRTTSAPIALLRAAWFMENAAWDVEAARKGVIPTFLQPLDHRIPMVATGDIARTAAKLLDETWTGVRVIELEGPKRYSANDIAAGFSAALERPVRAEAVPRDQWETLFRSRGMRNPMPRIRMIDGFNEGWIDFESGEANSRKERTTLEAVLTSLVTSNSL